MDNRFKIIARLLSAFRIILGLNLRLYANYLIIADPPHTELRITRHKAVTVKTWKTDF